MTDKTYTMKPALTIRTFLIIGFCLGSILSARADPVRNGNELALAWAGTNAAGKKVIQQRAVDTLHTFRYLRVIVISNDSPSAGAITLLAIEPSSEAEIALVITGRLSLELARTLKTNDCVAANGRITSMGVAAPNRLVVDPAILKHKDRSSPKLSKELLHEVDPTAH